MSDLWPNLGVPDPVSVTREVRAKPVARAHAPQLPKESTSITQKFEQLLWAEMLSHAGLEKSLTSGGGEGVSSFSRYVVEAIAEDIARKHPLGLAAHSSIYEQLPSAEVKS